ncbi:MAG: rhamnan synthesis F family protein [Bacteroidota bacterium]
MIAILVHIYYPDSWRKILLEQLLPLRKYQPRVLINLCNINSDANHLASVIRKDFSEAVIIITPNKGKDIGGKLALIDMFLHLRIQSDYIIMLHDKLSPQAIKGENWRKTLFNIISPNLVAGIIHDFEKDKRVGVIGSASFLMNEYNEDTHQFASTNNKNIKELLERYNIRPISYSFIGGTMFWIRTSIVKSFFQRIPALNCRETLEKGNIMDHFEGSYTHTWERLMCWIASAQNYSIKGI